MRLKVIFIFFVIINLGCNNYPNKDKNVSIQDRDVKEFKNKEAENFYVEGNRYSKEGNIDSAIISFKKSIKHEPRHVNTLNNLGNAFLKVNQPDSAINYFEKAIDVDNTYAGSYINITLVCLNTRQYQKGVNYGKKAIQFSVNDEQKAASHFNIAAIYYNLEECNLARKHYKLSIGHFKNDVPETVSEFGMMLDDYCK